MMGELVNLIGSVPTHNDTRILAMQGRIPILSHRDGLFWLATTNQRPSPRLPLIDERADQPMRVLVID